MLSWAQEEWGRWEGISWSGWGKEDSERPEYNGMEKKQNETICPILYLQFVPILRVDALMLNLIRCVVRGKSLVT